MVVEGVKDVFSMTPKELDQLTELNKAARKDPEFRKTVQSMREVRYGNRVIRKDIEKMYGKKVGNKSRGTQSSAQRKPVK